MMQNRLPSGSAKTTKSGLSGYRSQSTRVVGSIACVEIQMDSGGLLDGRLADIKRQMGTVA